MLTSTAIRIATKTVKISGKPKSSPKQGPLHILQWSGDFFNECCRERFQKDELVFDGNKEWHALDTCYWTSPSPITGYLDLRSKYPKLENLFVKRLRVKSVSLPMLIREVVKMAKQENPEITNIHNRLVGIGKILSGQNYDPETVKALGSLRKVPFLPKKLADGRRILVMIEDDFAILDNLRYGKAFANHDILLELDITETQIMHVLLQHYGLTSRYLSAAVTEQSEVSGESDEDFCMTALIRAKAYALYW